MVTATSVAPSSGLSTLRVPSSTASRSPSPRSPLLNVGQRLGDDEVGGCLDRGSDVVYLSHVELIARADGTAGRLARTVKLADLQDRRRRPRVRPDGWSPSYTGALE